MDKLGENGRKTAKEKSFLPDEIITNILIRLPVKSVIRCGLVCRRWGDIISARDFVDLHLKSSIPVILVETSKNFSRLDLFALDKWWEFARTRLTIHRFPFRLDKWWEFARTRLTIHRFPFNSSDFPNASYVVFSVAGLIVLKASYKPKYFILNPARPSCERVQITLCEEFWRSKLCAVYYHPWLKEYVSLWKIDETGPLYHGPNPFEYKLLNLGSNPSLKAIKNPFNYKVKDEYANPLFINNYLYWMLKSEQEYGYSGRNDILEFDIITEEFMVIPCPVHFNTECTNHQTHLLNSDGVLSFLLILPSTISIWTLGDHAQQLWTSREYTITINICNRYLAVVDGILAFECIRRLFICNLKKGTMKNYPNRKYNGNVSFSSHQMSLASLKNCKSALHINKDGEVLV